MPKHDLPDGNETGGNLIDFREYLQKRVGQSAQDNEASEPEPEPSDWETYRRAEYDDGKRAKFSRYDLLWIGMILVVGWIVWTTLRR
jgi:hypothetical protein